MKKIIACLMAGIMLSCNESDVQQPFQSQNQEYFVDRGILSFRDKSAFTEFLSVNANRSKEELDKWESSIGFTSLRSIHDKVILAETAFLDSIVAIHGDNSNLTRKEIGFTNLATKYLQSGLLVVNEFETLDVNVTAPYYATVVNEHGIFKIGNEIIMPTLNSIKIIRDGDVNKVASLRLYTESDFKNSVSVLKSTRQINPVTNGREMTSTVSCDNVVGSYRLISYVTEQSVVAEVEYPCDYIPFDYWFTLRSLKKVLGTWQNHQTSQWSVTTSLTADHWAKCDGVFDHLVRNVVTVNNQTINGPYDHTWNYYYVSGYDIGPCATGGVNSCSSGATPVGKVTFPVRSHDFYGKNGTFCHLP